VIHLAWIYEKGKATWDTQYASQVQAVLKQQALTMQYNTLIEVAYRDEDHRVGDLPYEIYTYHVDMVEGEEHSVGCRCEKCSS